MGAQAIKGKQQSLVTYSMNQEYKANNIFILSLGSNRWEDFKSSSLLNLAGCTTKFNH